MGYNVSDSDYYSDPDYYSDDNIEVPNVNKDIKKFTSTSEYTKDNGDNELLIVNYWNNQKFPYNLEPDDTILISNNLCFLDKLKKAYVLGQIDYSKFRFLLDINNYLLNNMNLNFLECKSVFNFILLNIQKSNIQFENFLIQILEKIEKQKKFFDTIDFFNFTDIMIIDIYYLIIKYYNNPIKYIKLIESSKLLKNENKIETYFLYGLLYSKNYLKDLNKKKLPNIKKEKALYIFKLLESIRYNNIDYIINNTIEYCYKFINIDKIDKNVNAKYNFLNYFITYDSKIIDIIDNNLFIIKYCIINNNNIKSNLERHMYFNKCYENIFNDIIKKRNIENIKDINDIKILLGLLLYNFYRYNDYIDFLIAEKELILDSCDKLISNLNTKENYNKMFKYISNLQYTYTYKTSSYLQYYLLSKLKIKLEKYNFLAFYSFIDENDFLNSINNNTSIINENFIKYAIICSNLSENCIIVNYLINNNLIPLTEYFFNLAIFKNSEILYNYFINNKYILNRNNINFINNYKIQQSSYNNTNIYDVSNSFLNNKLKNIVINTEENFSELDYIIKNNLYELLNKNPNDYNITATDIINSVIKTNNTIFLKELKISYLNKELEFFKNTINIIDKSLKDYGTEEDCMCLFSYNNSSYYCSSDCHNNMKILLNFIELEKIINKQDTKTITNKYNYIIYILNSIISRNYNIKIVILLLTMFYNKYKLKPILKCKNITIQIYIDNFLN